MIIIRPRNLISASLICLGLFLVSATPIPSPNSVPGVVVVNPPIMRTSAAISHATSQTSRHSSVALHLLLSNISLHMRDQPAGAEQIIRELQQIPGSIQAETDPDACRNIFYGVIARFKLFLAESTWNPTHRARAIAGIEVSEKAATDAGMTQARIQGEDIVTLDEVKRYMHIPAGVTEVSDGKIPEVSDGERPKVSDEKRPEDAEQELVKAEQELRKIVKALRYITIADLREIRGKSKAKYDKVKEEVENWPVGKLKSSAKIELKEWKAMNSLVEPQPKV